MWPQRLNEINRAKYQRILSLSKHHEVHFFVRGGQDISKEIRDHVFHIQESPCIKNLYVSHFAYLVYTAYGLAKLLLRNHIDIIYSFVDQTSVISFAVQKIFRKIWIADIIDYPNSELAAVEQDDRNAKRHLYRAVDLFFRKFLRHADLVIALGRDTKIGLPRELIANYAVPEEKIFPIVEGTDLKHTKPRNLEKDHTEFKVCYVGSLKRVRGVDSMIAATALAKEFIPNIRTYMLGRTRYPEDKDAIESMVDKHHLAEQTYLSLSGVPHAEVLDHIETSDVCLLILDPSKRISHYAYSIKLFEYLAMGKVVISTDCPGVEEVIRHEENGLIVPFGDPEALAMAFVRVARNPELKARLENMARPSIKDYDWELLNHRVLETINSKLVERN
jgi:glycosyltransferase involved in cell wall biosynthesis